MGLGGFTKEERERVIAEEKAKIEQERKVTKNSMDQREAMIAAIRAQVEKEKAEKEAKLKKEQEAMVAAGVKPTASSGGGSGAKKNFLSPEELARLQERKKLKAQGIDPDSVKGPEPEKPAEPQGVAMQSDGPGLGSTGEGGLGGAVGGESLQSTGSEGGLGAPMSGGLGLGNLGVDKASDDPVSILPGAQESGYNIDFEDENESAEEAAKKKAKRDEEAAKRKKAQEDAEVARMRAEEEKAKALAEARAKKEAEEKARRDAIEATKKAEEDARRAAELAKKKAAEEAVVKKAKEEAAKREAAEAAKRKVAEEAKQKKYKEELQRKADSTNKRLEQAVQKLVETNKLVAELTDKDQNFAKFVEDGLAKIDADAKTEVEAIKNTEADRVKTVVAGFDEKRKALDDEHANKEKEAAKALEEEKKAKAAAIEEVKKSQESKKKNLASENEKKKTDLSKQEEAAKKKLVDDENQAKTESKKKQVTDKVNLEKEMASLVKKAEDDLASTKKSIEAADGRIKDAETKVKDLEKQLEAAKKAVETEKKTKDDAVKSVSVKENAVAAAKADAEAKKAELERNYSNAEQQIVKDFEAKRASLAEDFVAKKNKLVDDFAKENANIDTETEKLVKEAEKALADVDKNVDSDKKKRQEETDAKKADLKKEEDAAIEAEKAKIQSEVDAKLAEIEKKKKAYTEEQNASKADVHEQLETAKKEAADSVQVYEIAKRKADEAMAAAKKLGIEISLPALDMEVPKNLIKAAPAPSHKPASKPEKAEESGDAQSANVPTLVKEYLDKYIKDGKIGASVTKAISEVNANRSGNKNILILGKHGFGSTCLGNDFARAYHAAGIIGSNKIANIKAAGLNKRPLESVKDKLKGGCLVVENANALTDERLKEIKAVAGDPANEICVMFTGEFERLVQVLASSGCDDLFGHTVSLTELDNDSMFNIAKEYITQLGYKTDDTGYARLKNKLKEIEDGNLDRYLKIVDTAVEKAKAQGENENLAPVDFD